MGSRRSVAGNIIILLLAVISLLGYVPWLYAALMIITIAILGSLPSRAKAEPASNTPASIPTPSIASTPESSSQDQHLSHSQARPIQRLPQAIIEALRPVPQSTTTVITPKPPVEEKKEIPDTGRPVERVISAGDYESFEYGLHEGEELSVEVSAQGPLNVYVLTEENLNSLDADQEFWYEVGSEGTRNTSLKFVPEESGTWFLVIENCENKDRTATIKLRVDSPSHPVPLLKSEKLDLPGGRFEGKLST